MDKWKRILEKIPGSYEDFVNDTADWMERDETIRSAILEQLRIKPDSDTDDVTLVLWKCLDIGEPLEIDEDEPRHKVRAAML